MVAESHMPPYLGGDKNLPHHQDFPLCTVEATSYSHLLPSSSGEFQRLATTWGGRSKKGSSKNSVARTPFFCSTSESQGDFLPGSCHFPSSRFFCGLAKSHPPNGSSEANPLTPSKSELSVMASFPGSCCTSLETQKSVAGDRNVPHPLKTIFERNFKYLLPTSTLSLSSLNFMGNMRPSGMWVDISIFSR